MISHLLRTGVLTGLLGLSSFSLFAQAAEPADSTKAVQRLFAKRRTGSTILALPGGYFLGYGAVSTAQGTDGGGVTLGLGAVLSSVAIAKSVRFSKAKEEEILSAYQQGKPIPKNIRRRLKQKHFKG
ncbi:hypothetical protein [Hymenobacter psychrotolerans]|uniref:Uncharacterized protein n=1 Tax=Hymenobacter psychrotolerans DSM 18569 TaxID=1121959 RepID=A0A1M6YH14_9BACT|nr:hypothetical protein [Hymenobacter psychrotolerans]SHL17604.1 hypothetical protein SAMN02746009_02253 [Hymenobacter psychrotolerans DSM 18569]